MTEHVSATRTKQIAACAATLEPLALWNPWNGIGGASRCCRKASCRTSVGCGSSCRRRTTIRSPMRRRRGRGPGEARPRAGRRRGRSPRARDRDRLRRWRPIATRPRAARGVRWHRRRRGTRRSSSSTSAFGWRPASIAPARPFERFAKILGARQHGGGLVRMLARFARQAARPPRPTRGAARGPTRPAPRRCRAARPARRSAVR